MKISEPEHLQPIINETLFQLNKGDIYQRIPIYIRAARYIFGNLVVGDIAEFGTAKGSTATCLALAVEFLNKEVSYSKDLELINSKTNEIIYKKNPRGYKKLYLVDSFEGLPEIHGDDLKMPTVQNTIWKKGSCLGFDEFKLDELMSLIMRKDSYEIIKGWYKDILQEIDFPKGLALVHLDCDLYNSTIEVLLPLFQRKLINPGCCILFDDFDCNAANPNLGQRKAWNEVCNNFHIKFDNLGWYGDACRAFIIHDYGQ